MVQVVSGVWVVEINLLYLAVDSRCICECNYGGNLARPYFVRILAAFRPKVCVPKFSVHFTYG
jgi:hypothetical protein